MLAPAAVQIQVATIYFDCLGYSKQMDLTQPKKTPKEIEL